MKRIEELGISPWPWSAEIADDDRFVIRDSEGYEIAQAFSGGYDSAIMSAAPDLYEALRGLLEIVCVDCKSSYEVDGKCVGCPRVKAARAALAKAAGEEVPND